MKYPFIILIIFIAGYSFGYWFSFINNKPKEVKVNFMQIGKISIWCTDTTCNRIKIKTDTTVNHYQMIGISQK